jgi:hypothetical protein
MASAAIVPAAVVVAYQLYVTALLLRGGLLTRLQLWVQLSLIWLLPLVGAAVCRWFFRLQGINKRPRGPNRAADTLDRADNIPLREHGPEEHNEP